MRDDKTHGGRKKHVLSGGYDPAQPILRGVNLVQCLEDGPWCDCFCDLCPPWEHRMKDCRGFCRSHVAGRDSITPGSSTGVI